MKNSPATLFKQLDHEIHVWMINPLHHDQPLQLNDFKQLLSTDEQEKVARYKFAKHRHDALVTRAFARDTLSKYLNISAAEISFSKGEHGKPDLHPAQVLQFNLSHTQGLIVCAVTKHAQLGIDCEFIDRNNDILNIAQRYFSVEETDELFSLPEPNQRTRFFDYWTLKESYIKACGQGLAIPLDHFSFLIKDHQASYSIGQTKTDISLSFSPDRNDQANCWHSWLCYPCETHRMAISIKTDPVKPKPVLKFFQSDPLHDFKEIKLDKSPFFV